MLALGSWADEMEDMPVPCESLEIFKGFCMILTLFAAGDAKTGYGGERRGFGSAASFGPGRDFGGNRDFGGGNQASEQTPYPQSLILSERSWWLYASRAAATT